MMQKAIWRWLAVCAAVIGVGTVVVGWPLIRSNDDGTIVLIEPSFVKQVSAEGDAAGASIVETEAGIAAYFKADTPVNLTAARPAFRTIETEGEDYLIGSIAIPNHEEGEDVHVYIHQQGWFVAYYLKDDPAVKLVDFSNMTGPTILTTFEAAITIATDAVGVLPKPLTYYDFRYPNANRMMLVFEDGENGNSFRIKLPSSFTYYERSVSCSRTWNVRQNDEVVLECDNNSDNIYYTHISSLAFPVDVFHTFRTDSTNNDQMAVAVIYREE